MAKRVGEEGEGRARDYGVYGIIQNMMEEGSAKFVNNSGRYLVDWVKALEYYKACRQKRDPDFNLPRRKLSNHLRTALLSSSYEKDGAKEYPSSKRVNNVQEVVERQFQMPCKVFKSLFGNAESSDISEEQDEQGADRAQVSPAPESSSDTGYDDTVNNTCGPSERVDLGSLGDPATVPGTYNQGGSSDIQMISAKPKETPTRVKGSCKIMPESGPMKGGYQFAICFPECLLDTVSSGFAEFEGVHTVKLEKFSPCTFVGSVPAARYPLCVEVKVTSECGDCLGTTFFSYYDDMADVLKVVVQNPDEQAALFSRMSRDLDPPNFEFQGDFYSSMQSKQKQSVKILELLVYTAAQRGAKQFIEMIFSTSSQRIVFDSYKDGAQLPEDVARANGHCSLAQYLEDITTRLSKEAGDKPKAIDWLELLKAVQNQVSVSQDKESKEETTSVESDGSSSDYFADTETSCGSFEKDDVFTSNSEGKDATEKDYPTGESKERLLEDPPYSSIPDVNHLEDSKPDEKQSDSSFLGVIHDDVDESFVCGASICHLRKENHRQDLVPKKVYKTCQDQEMLPSPPTLPCRADSLKLSGVKKGWIIRSPEFSFGICLSIAEMKAVARSFSRSCCSIAVMKEFAKIIFSSAFFTVGDFARFPGGTPSKWRYQSKEEKHVLMTENVVVSASTCRLKRPGCLVLSPLEADERQLNQELVIFVKSIGEESVHSPSTLLPSCPVLNKSRPQPDNSASLHGRFSGNVSWKNESNMKELKMERVRSWLSCNPNSDEFPSAEWVDCIVVSEAASQDKKSKGETTLAESDDNSSDYFANAERNSHVSLRNDYFANAETSSRASFEHDDEFTSNPEGKDVAEKGF